MERHCVQPSASCFTEESIVSSTKLPKDQKISDSEHETGPGIATGYCRPVVYVWQASDAPSDERSLRADALFGWWAR
jgi:hypothetical protein